MQITHSPAPTIIKRQECFINYEVIPRNRVESVETHVARMGALILKTLLKPENEAEANVIKSVLEEHGIYAEITSFHDTAYDGLFQSQYGWGRIRVSEKDLSEAQRIVDEWRSAAPEELPWENNSTDS